MSDTTAGLLQVGALVACPRGLLPPARRLHGPRLHQREGPARRARRSTASSGSTRAPTSAGRSTPRRVLAFSFVGVLLLYALQRLQAAPAPARWASPAWTRRWRSTPRVASSPTRTGSRTPARRRWATSCRWPASPCRTSLSAAVGIAVAVALIRGFTRSRTDRLGNFWVDLVRITVRILLPLAVVAAVVLIAMGAVQNFAGRHRRHHARRRRPDDPRRPGRLAGGDQGARHQRRRLLQRQLRPPVREPERADEPARDLPAAGDPVRLTADVRPDGRGQAPGLRDPGGDGRRCGASLVASVTALEVHHSGSALQAAGAAMEGKEIRFGECRRRRCSPSSTTGTSTGAVNSMHDSFTGLGGGAADVQHDARRGRARRGRLGPVRHARRSRSSRCSSPA